jgi:hypothetical protein
VAFSKETFICRHPCEAHHLRLAQPRALGRKVSDEFTVPLCRIHHDEIHRRGDEAALWASINIDPLPAAHRLWQHTRGLLPANDALSRNTLASSAPDGSVPNRDGSAEPAFALTKLRWTARTELRAGIAAAYQDYLVSAQN